ncbi:MAG TPA: orotidine-5'-phosphate decarboxylase [Verrucomicrobiae bacterium]|nr:orotidine-5'-phosphate decarboxylase [Verrucomicrobiae bacterium]
MALARKLRGPAGLMKIGSQLFTAEGPQAVERIAALGHSIFLDLKYHDIPNTVASAVRAAVSLPKLRLLTIHTSGGLAMMRAAREAAGTRKSRPKLLGVTILTSMDAEEMARVGYEGSPAIRAVELAKLAKQAGLDGAVASIHEVRAIREACGPEFILLVGGVRPATSATNDQSRIGTPAEAVMAGADYLVVGRPITGAADPRAAARAIAKEIHSAARESRKAAP